MTSSESTAWTNLLSHTQRRDKNSLLTVTWGLLSAILLVIVLGIVVLFLDLCAFKGRVTLSADQQVEWQSRLGQVIPTSSSYVESDYGQSELIFEDTGLLGTIYRVKQPLVKTVLGFLYQQMPALRYNAGLMTCLLLAGLFVGLLRLISYRMANRMSEQAARRVADLQRRQIHRHALRLGPSDLQDHAADEVTDLFLAKVEQVSLAIQETIKVWGVSLAQIVVLLVTMLLVDWRVTLQCLPVVALFYYVLILPRALKNETLIRQSQLSLNRQMDLLREDFEKARFIRGYAIEEYADNRFETQLNRFEAMQRDLTSQFQNREWLMWFLASVCLGLVAFLIGMKVMLNDGVPGAVSLSGAILIGLCIWQLYRPVTEALSLSAKQHTGLIAVETIHRFLQTKPEVAQAVGAKFIEPVSRFIQFEAVTYHSGFQAGRALLDQLELRLPAKTVTSIVGMKPIEAKALAYLLPRFIEPHAGRVLFDGDDIAWSTLESLRAETLYIGGENPFFTGSVLENLTLGDERITLNKATEATKMVHAHQFIQRLPQGYESQLGQHGEELDPGQVFRLCLARAAIRNPALLIVEEPAADFDDDTKALLEDAYTRLFQNRTVILLPHRLSSLKGSDQIVLLSHGKVEAIGKHADLLANVPLYRHWEYTNFNVYRHDKA